MAGQIIPLPTPPTSSLPPAQVARAWKAAQDFEAMAIGQFLQPMFQTVDLSKSLFGGGDAESTWQPMLVSEIAKQIEAHGGFGLAMPVFKEMLRMQEARTPAAAASASDNLQPSIKDITP